MFLHTNRPHGQTSVVSLTRGVVIASGLAAGLMTVSAVAQPSADNSPLLQERERQEAQESQNPTRDARTTQAGQQVMEFHTWDGLHGRNIVDSMNEKVGEIGDLIVDRRSGRIEYVVVQSGGFLNIGQREVAVDFDRLTFRGGTEQTLVLPMSKEELQGMKEFDPETFLTRNERETWGQTISTWEAANPGEDAYKGSDPYRTAFTNAQTVSVQGRVTALERMTHQRMLQDETGRPGQDGARPTPQQRDTTNPQRTSEQNQQDRARQEEQRRVEGQRQGQDEDQRDGQRQVQREARTGMQDEMVVMTVQGSDNRSHRVIIGPVWYVEELDSKLVVGQNVMVQAVPHQRGQNTLLVARSVRMGDRDMNFRDAEGRPAWAAEQVARDAARDTARWEQDREENPENRGVNDRRETTRPGQDQSDRPAGDPSRRNVQEPDRQRETVRGTPNRDDVDRRNEQDRSWADQNAGTTRMVLLSEVVGRDVSSMTEDDIGDITGAIIERNSGSVPFLVLNVDQNFLGIGGTDRIVPWRAVMLNADDKASIAASEQVITSSREMPDDVNTLTVPGVIDQIYGNFSVQRDVFQQRGEGRGVRNPNDRANPSRRTDGMPRDDD